MRTIHLVPLFILAAIVTSASATPPFRDYQVAFDSKVKKLSEGANRVQNDAYATTQANTRVRADTRRSVVGATGNSDGDVNVSSVVIAPGAKLVNPNIIIITTIDEITVTGGH